MNSRNSNKRFESNESGVQNLSKTTLNDNISRNSSQIVKNTSDNSRPQSSKIIKNNEKQHLNKTISSFTKPKQDYNDSNLNKSKMHYKYSKNDLNKRLNESHINIELDNYDEYFKNKYNYLSSSSNNQIPVTRYDLTEIQ